MDLTKTPVSERTHISFFGCVNVGKSSLINAFTNQKLSVVSDKKGTTTDPVKKTMELLPFGPVVVIDTPGFDDQTALGDLRLEKTNEVLNKTDIAILVTTVRDGLKEKDLELIELFKKKNIPYIIAYNKADLSSKPLELKENEISVSAINNQNVKELKDLAGKFVKKIKNETEKPIISNLLKPDDTVILVIPIDEAAPKGRLILPQQLVLRELLDNHNTVICVQDTELKKTIDNLKTPPKLIITDSQVFEKIKSVVSENIFLTSFSILFAKYKGDLKTLVDGAKAVSNAKNGAKILISEGCTHHRQCNDIGSVKLPKMLKKFTGKDFNFEFSSGGEFPNEEKIKNYDLIIHCGGCMLNQKEMQNRILKAKENNIPIVNYGVVIAFMNGILDRSIEIFKESGFDE